MHVACAAGCKHACRMQRCTACHCGWSHLTKSLPYTCHPTGSAVPRVTPPTRWPHSKGRGVGVTPSTPGHTNSLQVPKAPPQPVPATERDKSVMRGTGHPNREEPVSHGATRPGIPATPTTQNRETRRRTWRFGVAWGWGCCGEMAQGFLSGGRLFSNAGGAGGTAVRTVQAADLHALLTGEPSAV